MFTLRSFIKKGLLEAIGKMADYQIILNAAGWLEKNVLEEEDLAEIEQAIEDYHKKEEEEKGLQTSNNIEDSLEEEIEETEEPIINEEEEQE